MGKEVDKLHEKRAETTVLNRMKTFRKKSRQITVTFTQLCLSKLRLSLLIFQCRMKSLLHPLISRLSWMARGFWCPKPMAGGRMIFVDFDEGFTKKLNWTYGADK